MKNNECTIISMNMCSLNMPGNTCMKQRVAQIANWKSMFVLLNFIQHMRVSTTEQNVHV